MPNLQTVENQRLIGEKSDDLDFLAVTRRESLSIQHMHVVDNKAFVGGSRRAKWVESQ